MPDLAVLYNMPDDGPSKIPTLDEIQNSLGLDKMSFISEMANPEDDPGYVNDENDPDIVR
jgi:hypothetical protein